MIKNCKQQLSKVWWKERIPEFQEHILVQKYTKWPMDGENQLIRWIKEQNVPYVQTYPERMICLRCRSICFFSRGKRDFRRNNFSQFLISKLSFHNTPSEWYLDNLPTNTSSRWLIWDYYKKANDRLRRWRDCLYKIEDLLCVCVSVMWTWPNYVPSLKKDCPTLPVV